jgi:hypothetical protein
MAGSERNRKDKGERVRADQINMVVRLVLVVFEIVRTLVRVHVLHWNGPWRLL